MCQENKKQIISISISKEEYDTIISDAQKQNQTLLNRIVADFEESRKILKKELGIPLDESDKLKMIG